MNLTRRQAGLMAAAACLAPTLARAQAPPPAIIASPGDAAPDLAWFETAIARGADYLAAPIVAASDGTLIVAPGAELSAYSDIAAHPEFASRRTDKTVDGRRQSGWFSEDFTTAELKTLRTGPPARDSRAPPPALHTLEEVIGVARAGSVRTARVIGVAPRLTHPAFFAAQGFNLEPRLAQLIRRQGYDAPAAAMLVQSGQPSALKAFGELSRARRVQTIDGGGGPRDPSAPRYLDMVSAAGLSAVRAWAQAIAPAESLVIQPAGRGAFLTSGLVGAAHADGLAVFPIAAPVGPDDSHNALRARLTALFMTGADGVACEDVGQAVKARRDALDRMSDGRR